MWNQDERVQVSYCSIDQRIGKYESKYKWNNTQLYYSKKKKTFNGIHGMLSSSMHFQFKQGKKSTSFLNHRHLIFFYQTTLFNPLLSIKN